MHAKAYELLDLSRGDVVGEDDKEEFCEEYGIEFEDQHGGGAGRRTARSTTIGNKIIATSQWLQRTERDVSDWYDVPFQWDVEEVRLPPEEDPNAQEGNKYTPDVALRRRADRHPRDDPRGRYKGDNDLVGFADMLERVAQRSLVPNVDYLIIDEFQDITTLQYNVFEVGTAHAEGAHRRRRRPGRLRVAGRRPRPPLGHRRRRGRGPPELLPAALRILNVVNAEIRHIDKRQEKDLPPARRAAASKRSSRRRCSNSSGTSGTPSMTTRAA